MKRFIGATLSILITCGAVSATTSVKAQEAKPVSSSSSTINSASNYQVTPFALAYFAYWGYFKNQGIPSYAVLLTTVASGKIHATDIVQAAIRSNRLPQETLNNQRYIDALEEHLITLHRGS